MKAAFVKRKNRVRIENLPRPVPGKSEVLLKIEACGICGSDAIEARSWAKKRKRFGHEIVATVTQAGEEITGLIAGDQVVIALSIACGICAACRQGNPRLCNRLITAEQGGFAEYLLITDPRLLYKVDPPLPIEQAVFAEPLTVVLDALYLADLQAADHFLVVGGGFIATLALLAAKTFGADIVGLLNRELRPNVNVALSTAGGDHFLWKTVAGKTVAAPRTLRKRLSGLPGRVVVLHCAPARHIKRYLKLLPYGSTVINIGLSSHPRENRLKIDGSNLIFNRTQLMSAFPVPCLYLPQAVSILRTHAELFSRLPVIKRSLDQLPGIILRPGGSGEKILVIPGG